MTTSSLRLPGLILSFFGSLTSLWSETAGQIPSSAVFPTLEIEALGSEEVAIRVRASAQEFVVLWASENLSDWTPVGNGTTGPGGEWHYRDSQHAGGQRYYRVTTDPPSHAPEPLVPPTTAGQGEMTGVGFQLEVSPALALRVAGAGGAASEEGPVGDGGGIEPPPVNVKPCEDSTSDSSSGGSDEGPGNLGGVSSQTQMGHVTFAKSSFCVKIEGSKWTVDPFKNHP